MTWGDKKGGETLEPAIYFERHTCYTVLSSCTRTWEIYERLFQKFSAQFLFLYTVIYNCTYFFHLFWYKIIENRTKSIPEKVWAKIFAILSFSILEVYFIPEVFTSGGTWFAASLHFVQHFVLKHFCKEKWIWLCTLPRWRRLPGCQGALFSASSPTEFSANGSLLVHAHQHPHMPMHMRKGGVSPSFFLKPKTADACKNGHLAILELTISWVRVEPWFLK